MYNFTDAELVEDCFNKLIAQGGFSTYGMECRYRSENGRKCAAGQYIPDEDYDPDFEGCVCYDPIRITVTIYHISVRGRVDKVENILKKQGLDPAKVRKLQEFHDHAADHYSYHPCKMTITETQLLTNIKQYILQKLSNGEKLESLNATILFKGLEF